MDTKRTKATDYFGSKAAAKPLTLPTIRVSSKPKSASKTARFGVQAFNVDSLEKAVSAFDENQRILGVDESL